VHCLNNLLQGPRFGPGDLAEIGVQLDHQERLLLHDSGTGISEHGLRPAESLDEMHFYNVDPSADGGNFSIQVLTVAISRYGLELLPMGHPRAKDLMKEPGMATEAFLCQYRDHWFAVRKVADCWWNLNSTRSRPITISPFYLAAWLSQLDEEKYSIYLVLGAELPAPMPPLDSPAPDDNFHDVYDLLERSKKSGGNPLAGGEDDSDADAAFAAAQAAEWNSQEMQGSLVLSNELVPFQTREFSANPVHGQPSVHCGSWLHDLFSSIQLWPCGGREHLQTAQSSSESTIMPSPNHSPLGGQCASSSGQKANVIGSDELRDMGFTYPLIRVAEELAAGLPMATPMHLLLNIQTSDSRHELEGQALARAIQDAVLHCDTTRQSVYADRLLSVVALLSLDQARLQTAKSHIGCDVLSDFLRNLIETRGPAWPPAFSVATAIALEMLAVFPKGATYLQT